MVWITLSSEPRGSLIFSLLCYRGTFIISMLDFISEDFIPLEIDCRCFTACRPYSILNFLWEIRTIPVEAHALGGVVHCAVAVEERCWIHISIIRHRVPRERC